MIVVDSNILVDFILVKRFKVGSECSGYDRWAKQKGKPNKGMYGCAIWLAFSDSPSNVMSNYGMKFSVFSIRQGSFHQGFSWTHWNFQQSSMDRFGDEKIIVEALNNAWRSRFNHEINTEVTVDTNYDYIRHNLW